MGNAAADGGGDWGLIVKTIQGLSTHSDVISHLTALDGFRANSLWAWSAEGERRAKQLGKKA